MMDLNTAITIILGSISIFSTIIAVNYAYKTYWISKSPKIVIEISFNTSLELRNIGTDIAQNIKETTDFFRDVPNELWNFAGPIDYMRIKNSGISRTINFHDDKRPQPSTSTVIRFEYTNADGDEFYSEVMIKRREIEQIYFSESPLQKWGRLK